MIVLEREINGGGQTIHRFDNGYGASVIRGGFYAYGGLELAVLKFADESPTNYSLCYDTEITDDVLGYLSEDDVVEILEQIENLEGE